MVRRYGPPSSIRYDGDDDDAIFASFVLQPNRKMSCENKGVIELFHGKKMDGE